MAERDDSLEAALAAERGRLVGLCAHLAGSFDPAEDLAQETLYEAWRNLHKLRDSAALGPWLSAIARNICLRWRSSRSRIALPAGDACADDWIDEAGDIELELERHELADLLGRALGLLSPETRAVLVRRYIDQAPHAEIAAAVGLSEGAVKMRLRRGKLALRHVLTTDLAPDAVAYGLLDPDAAGWQETRLWCSLCGNRRLEGRIDPALGDFQLRCPDCYRSLGLYEMRSGGLRRLLGQERGFRARYTRLEAVANRYYRDALATGTAICLSCGRPAAALRTLPDEVLPRSREWRGVQVRCPGCGDYCYTSLSGLLNSDDEARRFRRVHPRTRTLPEREIEAEGRPALVSTLESVSDGARLDIVSDRDTFAVLQIHRRDDTAG